MRNALPVWGLVAGAVLPFAFMRDFPSAIGTAIVFAAMGALVGFIVAAILPKEKVVCRKCSYRNAIAQHKKLTTGRVVPNRCPQCQSEWLD